MFSADMALFSLCRLLKLRDYIRLFFEVGESFFDCEELRDRFEIVDRFNLRFDRSLTRSEVPQFDPLV
jgi:hypothetical protein